MDAYDKTKVTVVSTPAAPPATHSTWTTYGTDGSAAAEWMPALALHYDGAPVGYGWHRAITPTRVAVRYTLAPHAAASDLLHRSLLHALVQHIVQTDPSAQQLSMELRESAALPKCVQGLTRFGFVRNPTSDHYDFVIPPSMRIDLQPLKAALRQRMTPENQVGRGFSVDVRDFDPLAIAALRDEYHRLAWGFTQWARHAEIASDEAQVLQQFVVGSHALEVGAGSGRMTAHMRGLVGHLTATDYCADIVQSVRNALPHDTDITIVTDDITHSHLASATYDLVAFWENGLGALLTLDARQRAIQEMVRLLMPGGRLILALRTLSRSPIDHVMPVAQDPRYMGIYHTFTADEVHALMPTSMHCVAHIVGDDRPAGGHAFFLIYEKERA